MNGRNGKVPAISVVTQDTSLLHRSIRDNIAYGRPDASSEDIARAAAHWSRAMHSSGCPGGTTESSPGIHDWESGANPLPRPVGTADLSLASPAA